MENTSATLLQKLHDPTDGVARQRLADLYTPLLYSWAKHRFGLRVEDAEDLVQEMFAVLFEKLPTFAYNQHRRFRGWLWTIMRNQFLTRCRRAKVAQQAIEELSRRLPEELEANPVEEEEFQHYIVRRAAELLKNEFEEKTWQAFWKYVVEGREPKAVAEELGMTLPSVYTAKSRVLQRLRQEFEGLVE